ncbi:MAG: hypothetical protein ACRYFS_11220 [Janthinobacterium lividum]
MNRLPLLVMMLITVGCFALFGIWRPLAAQNKVPQDSASQKPDLALKVTVNPRLIHVYSGEQLSLRLQVTNASATAQTFQVMSCSWPDEWKSSGAHLSSLGFACAANAPIAITLAPHAAYDKTLVMNVGAMPKGKVAFRMGFTPWGATGSKTTYWSDKVPVQVN